MSLCCVALFDESASAALLHVKRDVILKGQVFGRDGFTVVKIQERCIFFGASILLKCYSSITTVVVGSVYIRFVI